MPSLIEKKEQIESEYPDEKYYSYVEPFLGREIVLIKLLFIKIF